MTNHSRSSSHGAAHPAANDSNARRHDPSAPCVFISYSHDSDAHRERVLGLSERLRNDGILTILDRYVERGSPAEGWPRWMLNGLDQATHVLCVCTAQYYSRFRGQEVPGKGKGVDWEGAIMTQSLYDARSVSNKFIPVLFARTDEPYIPEPLRGQTFYVLDSETGYESLYDALLSQAGVEPAPVGPLKRKPRATGQPSTFGGESNPKARANPLPTSTASADSDRKLPTEQVIDAAEAKPHDLHTQGRDHSHNHREKTSESEKKRRTLITVATMVVVLIAVIGTVVALLDGNASAPRVRISPPVGAEVIGDDLLVTVNFSVENLGDHEVWVDVGTDTTFAGPAVLKNLRVSPAHRAGPQATVTVQRCKIQAGHVRIRVVDRRGTVLVEDKAAFRR